MNDINEALQSLAIKRDTWLNKTRVSRDELSEILAKSQSAGLSLSRYVREACLNASVIARESLVDKSLVLALSAIGNNLNQIARKVNIHDDIDPILQKNLHDTLDRINDLIDKIIYGS